MKISLWLSAFVMLLSVSVTHAGSATWNLNPSSGDWNTAANWTPATVPNGPSDVATFGASNTVLPSLSSPVTLNSIVFEGGAAGFTIFASGAADLTIAGEGIVNNSGKTQILNAWVGDAQRGIQFEGNATAGTMTDLRSISGPFSGFIWFRDQSSAGSASLTALASQGRSPSIKSRPPSLGGQIIFTDQASAADATITSAGGYFRGGNGGLLYFLSGSTAGNATITASGATAAKAHSGTVSFSSNSSAGNATLIADGGANGGEGGNILFSGDNDGGTARVEVLGNGRMDISQIPSLAMAIGSIEGDGALFLGGANLSVGTNNLSTTFSGEVQDGGNSQDTGGSLTKVGSGTLTLTGTNTYSGGTTLDSGILRINNLEGSGAGPGNAQVNAGTIGGSGAIAGSLTLGTGSGTGAFLQPGVGASNLTVMTIESGVTFRADSTYTYKLNTKKAKADQVVANGVTIQAGAQFDLNTVGNKKLTTGKAFTAISNTAATPISGTFANLANGSTVTVGVNKFQVSYSGGDGNDLTLTTVP